MCSNPCCPGMIETKHALTTPVLPGKMAEICACRCSFMFSRRTTVRLLPGLDQWRKETTKRYSNHDQCQCQICWRIQLWYFVLVRFIDRGGARAADRARPLTTKNLEQSCPKLW